MKKLFVCTHYGIKDKDDNHKLMVGESKEAVELAYRKELDTWVSCCINEVVIEEITEVSGFEITVGENNNHRVLIEKAREQYQTDEIRIDLDASVLGAEDGYWVSAWVWIPKEDKNGDC